MPPSSFPTTAFKVNDSSFSLATTDHLDFAVLEMPPSSFPTTAFKVSNLLISYRTKWPATFESHVDWDPGWWCLFFVLLGLQDGGAYSLCYWVCAHFGYVAINNFMLQTDSPTAFTYGNANGASARRNSSFSHGQKRMNSRTSLAQREDVIRRTIYVSDIDHQVEEYNALYDAAKELYDKLLKSVKEQRTAPPNNLLWSLIEKSANREDIKLLFNILENLRKFRLSNLRIFYNFNDNLCREVSKACVRVEAIDLGKKTLWKHNVYGLTPSVASAHSLLLYAKEHKYVDLMVDVMKLLKANDVPLQPGTADIVFSICYETNSWELMCKYAKRFVKAGVKLRRTSFDTWMTFAAKLGDVDNLWKIEKLRSELMKTHTIGSGFSCAKGFLL